MKKALVLAALLVSAMGLKAQTAEEIITKNVAAMGGQEKLENIKAYTLKKSYKANAPTDYDEEIVVVKAEGKLARKKTILGRDFFYVTDGKVGWLKIPMGSRDKAPTYSTKDLPSSETNGLISEAKDGLAPYLNFAQKGYKNNGVVTSAVVNGVDCNTFTLEKGGVKRTFYFDKNTNLLRREVIEESGVTTTIDNDKFKTVDGITYPSESKYINTKDKRNTSLTTDLIINQTISDQTFKK